MVQANTQIKLRDYQQNTVDYIINNMENGVHSQLINAPTGAGKTVIASELVSLLVEQGKKIFFVVANQPLIMQTYNKFVTNGIFPSIIQRDYNSYYNPDKKVQIVMIQTYSSRIEKLPDLKPDVIIVDEVDFGYEGQMLKKLLEKHKSSQIVGLTGTPITFKGCLLPGFDIYHEVITVRELQEKGFLSIDKNYIPVVCDTSNIRVMTTGEFNEDELEQKCSESYFVNDIITTYKKVNKGYKGIVFAISINHGEILQKAFNEAGIRTGLIHSKMKKYQQDYWLEAHKSGRIQLLVNVGKLTRGYDDTEIIDCIMTRPTMSLALYLQMVGRCARVDKSGKKFFRHFDYAGNIERFGLWSEPRLYETDKTPKKENDYNPVVCPFCFSVIYERTNRCPECGETLKEQHEKREREIKDNLRAKEIIEIKAQTDSDGAIEALTKLLNRNGNSFYYMKLLPMKTEKIPNETFNAEVIRLANYAKKKEYNPNYVYYRMKEKLENYR